MLTTQISVQNTLVTTEKPCFLYPTCDHHTLCTGLTDLIHTLTSGFAPIIRVVVTPSCRRQLVRADGLRCQFAYTERVGIVLVAALMFG